MAIQVARGVLGRIRKEPDHLIIAVEAPDAIEGARVALERAGPHIMALDAGSDAVAAKIKSEREAFRGTAGMTPTQGRVVRNEPNRLVGNDRFGDPRPPSGTEDRSGPPSAD